MKNTFNVVACASGGGGNFQAIIDAMNELDIKITCLITDRECGAVKRAIDNDIEVLTLVKNDGSKLDYSPLNHIYEKTDLVVLCGFMPIVPDHVCEQWSGKMINTHPSLLPRHGGIGMYGVKVQEAVMAAGDKVAGCSVHYVSNVVDGGEVIVQRSIDVDESWTPWELGGKVFLEENVALVEAIRIVKQKLLKKEG